MVVFLRLVWHVFYEVWSCSKHHWVILRGVFYIGSVFRVEKLGFRSILVFIFWIFEFVWRGLVTGRRRFRTAWFRLLKLFQLWRRSLNFLFKRLKKIFFLNSFNWWFQFLQAFHRIRRVRSLFYYCFLHRLDRDLRLWTREIIFDWSLWRNSFSLFLIKIISKSKFRLLLFLWSFLLRSLFERSRNFFINFFQILLWHHRASSLVAHKHWILINRCCFLNWLNRQNLVNFWFPMRSGWF